MSNQTNNTTSPNTIKRSPVNRVMKLRPYSSQKSNSKIDLKLDANEGPFNCLPFGDIVDPESLRNYPSKAELERQIADRLAISSEEVIVTCGGDELIDRACRVFLEPGRNIIVTDPTFVMIEKYATMAGGDIRKVEWSTGAFPVEAVCSAADVETAIIAIVSPNNPTGLTASSEDLREIASRCPQAVILLDQAYAEFESINDSAAENLTQVALKEIPQAIIVRTFSKAWGLAGLRVGYGLARAEMIEWLARIGGPYPVSGPSLAIASAAMQLKPEGDAEYIAQVCQERDALQQLLNAKGAKVLPSQANFVFARFSNPSASQVCDALASSGISVRSFATIPDALRITCPGNLPAFQRLCSSLDNILANQPERRDRQPSTQISRSE